MREVLTRPSPIKKVKRRRFLSRLVFSIILLFLIFIGIGLLSGIPKLLINEVSVTGTESLSPSELGQFVLNGLSGNKFLVYKNANKFIFSKTKIENMIMSSFPRVYKVSSIDREKQKISIVIEERHAAYTWCGHEAPLYKDRFTRGECYFLDQEGFVFDYAPKFSEGVYLSIYGGLPLEKSIIGETIDLENNIEDVAKILKVLNDNGLPVHSLVLSPDGQHQFLLDIVSANGDYPKIFWNEDTELSETLGKLGSALSEEKFLEEWNLRKEYLLYVDTRFNNRVFYKFATEI